MNTTLLSALLLVAVTLVSGEGAIRVFNNVTFQSELSLGYKDDDGRTLQKYLLDPGETKTLAFPEGATDTTFKMMSVDTERNRVTEIIEVRTSTPIKLCLKVWGPVDKPKIGQSDCSSMTALVVGPGDDGAISVTNNATNDYRINLQYILEDDGHSELLEYQTPPVIPGETKTVLIPSGATDTFFDLVHPKEEDLDLFNAYFNKPVKLCFKIWGTNNDLQSGQIDC